MENLDFPLSWSCKIKQLTVIEYLLKNSIFNIFVQVHASEQTFFNFLILWKSRFPPKKFYNIDYWSFLLMVKNIVIHFNLNIIELKYQIWAT